MGTHVFSSCSTDVVRKRPTKVSVLVGSSKVDAEVSEDVVTCSNKARVLSQLPLQTKVSVLKGSSSVGAEADAHAFTSSDKAR